MEEMTDRSVKGLRFACQALKQMKQLSNRLLKKATKLQDIIADTIDAESDEAVMRSDRAADVSTATGYSSRHRHRHRKHGRRTSFTARITSRISRSTRRFLDFL